MFEEVGITDNSYIEYNLIKSLGTPHFVQTLLAVSRVKIKNNAVTSVTSWQIAYSFCWVVIVTYSGYVFQEFYFRNFFYKDMLMYISCLVSTGMQTISYFFTIIINRFFERDKNAQIYSMLQRIDRTLQLDKCSYYTDFQHRWNVITVTVIIILLFIGFAAHAFGLLDKPLNSSFFVFAILSMFMDNFLGTAMLYFLGIRVKIFNAVIKKQIDEYERNLIKKSKVMTLKKILFSLVIPKVQTTSALDFERDKWLNCLQDMLKSYRLVTELFSFSVFNLASTMLIWTFTVIAVIIIGNRTGLYPPSVLVTIAVWNGSYYLQLIVLSIVNDWFVKEIKKMKLLCIRLISCDYDGPFQKTASEMIKVIHYEPPTFVVYGIFVLDKQLPIEIVGVIASNVLVLLQFII